jgi:predicted ATPase
MHILKRVDLKGYKSIKDASLELGALNVLIGANGSGKSNLVSFFKLLNHMMTENLQGFVATSGGANSLLHYGARVTPQIEAALQFESHDSDNEYRMRLGHAAEDTLIFLEERISFQKEGYPKPWARNLRTGHKETALVVRYDGIPARPQIVINSPGQLPRIVKPCKAEPVRPPNVEETIDVTTGVFRGILDRCRVFQFHDTSSTANIRQKGDINQDRFLMSDGGNLAALLYRIQRTQPDCYQRIVGTIRQIAPFFGDFNLAPSELNPEVIQLRWKELDRDYDFGPHLLSDGTLRAMAMVTLLLQPTKDLPSVIIIDEPEIGLHPYAIATLAGLLRSASVHSQVIVATESATLLDHFEPQDVVVTERCMGETVFKRLDPKELSEWREDYCLSELWDKNVIGGRPSR